MHIGLIGGIGVASTVVYYQRLTAAIEAAGSVLDLTIEHANVHDLIRTNREDKREEQAQYYAKHIDRLAAAGCDCVAITSLGGHFCFDETVALSSLPLVSAVAPLDTYFAAQGHNTVGLLGTRVVMKTGLYGQLTKTRAVELVDENDIIGQTYVDMALAGRCTSEQRAFFLDAGQRLMETQGADAIVLAGTDLNLAFDGQTTDYPVIDALDVHVDVLARLATDQINLHDVGAE
jgi:aspartate racemase